MHWTIEVVNVVLLALTCRFHVFYFSWVICHCFLHATPWFLELTIDFLNTMYMRGKGNNEQENPPLATDEPVEVLRLHENYQSFEEESIQCTTN